MKDQVLKQMDELGWEPALRRLVERLPDDQPVIARPGRGDWLLVAASLNQDAALYLGPRDAHLKLNPADAEKVVQRTGLRLAEVNGQTGYVFVSSQDAGRADLQTELDDAFVRALRRHLGGPPQDAHGRNARVCPTSGLQLPANGYCDEHEGACPRAHP